MARHTSNDRKLKTLKQKKNAGRREKESSARSKSGRSDRPFWFRDDTKKWSIFIGLSLIFSILLFPSILTPPKTYNLGDVADRDIKASREFLVENTELTEKNRQEAIRAVLPVYDFDPTATDVVPRVREAFALGRKYLSDMPFSVHWWSVIFRPKRSLSSQSSAPMFLCGVWWAIR
ncbi:MAG: hypothetical protein B6240_03220 [Desulfobacteraceae bacterium 4572_87]|nr:MAG: hypothetical protein B6240_03220 [Desulfobacteraceae bacterium 4572_87]